MVESPRKEWLEKATRLLDQSQEWTALGLPPWADPGHERMEIEVLRHEAERLIHGTKELANKQEQPTQPQSPGN